MSIHSLIDSPVSLRLGWTLLHSVWQVILVAAALAVCLSALHRRDPQVASIASIVALLSCLALPFMTFCLLPESAPTIRLEHTKIKSSGAFPIPHVQPSLDHRHRQLTAQAATDESVSRVTISSGSRQSVDPPVQQLTAKSPYPISAQKSFSAFDYETMRRGMTAFLPPIVAFWLAGVLILSMWNCGVWFAVQRLKMSATIPVTASIEQAAARLANLLGIRHAVRLLQSTLIDSPVVIGAFKPVILLPMALVLELPPDQLEALLAHELAHILRRDYLVNLLQTAIETLLFYHPAVWWITAQVRREREHCCDDLALRTTDNPTIYVQALAAVAGARTISALPAANGGQLLYRLQRIMGIARPESGHPSRWLAGLLLLSSLFLVTVVNVMSQQTTLVANASDAKKNPTEKKNENEKTTAKVATKREKIDVEEILNKHAVTTGSMTLKVVDPDGMPMPDADIYVSIWTDENDFEANKGYTTNKDGIALIKLPKTVRILRIWSRKAGHCPLFVQWWAEKQDDGHLIPEEYTFPMRKGTVISGFVKDADGKPIRDVKVQVRRTGHLDSTGGRHDGDTWLAEGDDPNSVNGPKFTDEQGRWSLDNVPADEHAEVELFLNHPDYISDIYWGGTQKDQNVTIADFRKHTGTIVLKKGVRVSGRLVDPEGNPVKDAVVIWGEDPYFTQGSQEVLTDEDGQYKFPALPAEKTRITIAAKGWMPDSRIVDLSPGMDMVNFQLKPGKLLTIKLVDRAGQPVTGVYVGLSQWRHKALYNEKHPNVINTQIPRSTNDEGIFEWTWAPEDAVTWQFGKEGFAHIAKSIVADDTLHTIVLDRSTTLSGTVTDAKTGQPILNAVLVPIDYFQETYYTFERYNGTSCKDGQFAHVFIRDDIKFGIEIEAPGYRTFRTPKRYQMGDVDEVFDVRMEPVEPYKGKLLNADGAPVSEARVYLATDFQHLDLYGFDERGANTRQGDYDVKTGADGSFEIYPQIDRYKLVAVSAQGYAEITREPDQLPGEIRLKPWAKVFGRVTENGTPLANQEVTLRSIGFVGVGEPNRMMYLQTKTDSRGDFRFERVPAEACHVSAYLHFSRDSALKSSQSVPLQLNPGESAHVELGGKGIDVVGRLVVEEAPANFDYHFSLSYLMACREGIAPPASIANKGFDWHKGWNNAWRGSQEGQAYLATLHTHFVKPDPDGTIRISGVEPGEYELAVNLYGSTEGCLVHPVAQRVIPITVKPGDTTLDLGTLTIPSMPIPKVGEPAPEVDLTDANGHTFPLSSLRGRYVLIDFWASWCSFCTAMLPSVEKLRQQYEPGKQLVVISANLDADRSAAESVIKKLSMGSRHVMLGDWTDTGIPHRFGVSSLPTYILIDPKGTIIIFTASLDQIEEALKSNGVK